MFPISAVSSSRPIFPFCFQIFTSAAAWPCLTLLLHQLTDGAVKGKLGQTPGKEGCGESQFASPSPAPIMLSSTTASDIII